MPLTPPVVVNRPRRFLGRRRARSIVQPILTLVLASVMGATLAIFAITFKGPPPFGPPLRMPDIVAALQTGRSHGRNPMIVEQRRILPRDDLRNDVERAAMIARAAGLPVGQVVVRTTFRPPFGSEVIFGSMIAARRMPDGWRIVRSRPQPILTNWHILTLSVMLGVLVSLGILAWAVARAISRPLRQLATAAEQARIGAPLGAIPTSGSYEVRELTQAFASMHARLGKHAEARMAMLAAIAHDLGTPLSRIAFWIEQLPETARNRASADIDEMRAMIGATLNFARDEAGERDSTRIDLGSMIDALVEDMAAAGSDVTIADQSIDADPLVGSRAIVRGDPGALRRLFANLIENAVRYGTRARMHWQVRPGRVIVWIDDDGPGIDPDEAERLFEPFVRGDPSRNRATGGTGLGLAIVRSIATRSGGTVTLEARAGGGSRATVVLPLA